jgi:uncharacterized membrane protein YphA (DoxX/SURF4 family)
MSEGVMKNKKEIAIDIISALFVLLFLYASLTKLLDYQKFTVQLGQSPMLTSIAGFVAWFIPVVELVIAVGLIFTRTRLIALHASLFLMVMFSGYIIAITQFSFYVPCSCGGILNSLGWVEHFIFNMVFVVLATVAILLHGRLNPAQDTTAALT